MASKHIQIIGSLIPNVASAEANGLMSSADKINLDNLLTIVENYILNINYETLAFNTSELVIGGSASGASSPILGTGMLGYMVLG